MTYKEQYYMKKVYLHRFMILTALLVIAALIIVGCAPGQQSTQPVQPTQPSISTQDAEQIAYDATTYGFPLCKRGHS